MPVYAMPILKSNTVKYYSETETEIEEIVECTGILAD
jgi:hypothetical protein